MANPSLRLALGKFGELAIKYDRAIWPRRDVTSSVCAAQVINNSQHLQPSKRGASMSALAS